MPHIQWRTAGLSERVVSGRLIVMCSAVTWAVNQGILRRDVLAGGRCVGPGCRPRTHLPVSVVRDVVALAQHESVNARAVHARRPGSPAGLAAMFRAHQVLLIVYLVADAGLRRGEIAGLRSDDLEGQVLWVERALKWTRGGRLVGPPKTYHRAGQRERTDRAVMARVRERVVRVGSVVGSGSGVAVSRATRRGASGLPGHDRRPVHRTGPADRSGRDQVGGAPGPTHRRDRVGRMGEIARAQQRLRHHRLDRTLRHYVDTTGLGDDVGVADELERYYRTGGEG